MDFHLQFPVKPFSQKISHAHKIMLMGSCFADNIGERLDSLKLGVKVNPNGILYNPEAILKALDRYAAGEYFKEDELFQNNDVWNSWEHHSRFSNPDKSTCLSDINRSIKEAHHFLRTADWLFITFGSAYTYILKEKNISVGNCHKIPQEKFNKVLQDAGSIVEDYKKTFAKLRSFNPHIKIALTVSPVRYIRDGVVENNLSKAILLQSVHQLCSDKENVFYFPAYELVIDDLRDYRFYERDLVHPNQLATDYVFDKLKEASFDTGAMEMIKKLEEIISARSHKPFNESSEAHKKFRLAFYDKCLKFKEQYPSLDISEELSFFQ